jgi:RNA-directed DNA polymerase
VGCRRDGQEPLQVGRRVLERLGLSLNEAKTQSVDATQASVDFLGFAIRMSRGRRTGNPYPHGRPSDKSLRTIKTKLTALTGRARTPIGLQKIVENANRSLKGWGNYFHSRNSSQVREKVKTHAAQRLRLHLRKRHKVKDSGIGAGRFPSVDLYRRSGLYNVPTAAGWRSAHALA